MGLWLRPIQIGLWGGERPAVVPSPASTWGRANPGKSVCPWESAGFSPTITLRFGQFCKLVGETQERLSPQACAPQSPSLQSIWTGHREEFVWAAGCSSSLKACRTELGSVAETEGPFPSAAARNLVASCVWANPSKPSCAVGSPCVRGDLSGSLPVAAAQLPSC